MTKSRSSMLAMAELFTRRDVIDAQIVKLDDKLRRLGDNRVQLVAEHEQITAGINAIGLANGLIRPVAE